MNKKIGLIIGIIFLLILIVSIPLAIKLVQERQNLQKKAAVPGGTSYVSLSAPDSVTSQQKIPLTVAFKVTNSPNGIIGIRTALKITSSGSSSLVSVTENDITNSLTSLRYFNPTITTDGSTTSIVIQAAYLEAGSGFLGANGDTFVNFAVVNLLAAEPGTLSINFDMSDSYVKDKGGNLDVLNDQSTGKNVTINSQSTSSITNTPTPTTIAATSTITNTPTPTTSSTGRGGGTQPTNTPTPTRTSSSSLTPTPTTISNAPTPTPNPNQVTLTSLASGQTVTSTKPVFSGKAPAGSTVTITVYSNPVTGTAIANSAGVWTWTPPTDLSPGSHSVTITAATTQGVTTTTNATFTVGTLPVTGNTSQTIVLLLLGVVIILPALWITLGKTSVRA